MCGSPRLSEDPRTIDERRLMPDMLCVAASQVSNPIPLLVLMVAFNRLLHDDQPPSGALVQWLFRALRGGKISPAMVRVFIEAPDKHHLTLEMAEFREANATGVRVDHPGVELADDIQAAVGRQIDIASTGVSGVGK